MDETKAPHGFGSLSSAPILDYRQINLTHVAGATPELSTFPASFHIDYSTVPDLNQGGIGACTCHTCAEIGIKRNTRKGGAPVVYSPRFLYALSKINDGLDPSIDGTYAVMPFKMAVKFGLATVATVANDTTLALNDYIFDRQTTNIPPTAFAEADQNRVIPGYVQVGQTGAVDEASLKQALMAGDGVSLCLPVGAEWWTKADGTPSELAADILPIRKMVTEIGGHDITATGWETEDGTGRTKVYFRNHWGTAWADGDNGWFYFDDHTFTEAWMVSEIPDALLKIVQMLPARKNFVVEFKNDLAPGTTSEDVMNLQITLKILGTFPFNQPVTRYFGPITQKAVMDFQTEYNVTTAEAIAQANGNLGPKTRAVINNLMARK